jgi:hypothetical protein
MRVCLSATWLASLLGLLLLGASPGPVAAAPMLAFPAPPGTEWGVLAGYNTPTHSEADKNDPYALDLWRFDGPTEGTPVLAPVSGTVSFVSTSCLTIRDAARTSILMCHIHAAQSLRGQSVARGQQIATVAGPSEAGNGGTPHIHIGLSPSGGGPLPFSGNYALEGVDMPATSAPNAYLEQRFVSTITPAPVVNAGPDQTVQPRSEVTLAGMVSNPAGTALHYQWSQISGTNVTILSPTAQTAYFVAPLASTTLQFRLSATDVSGDTVSDTVSVRVSGSATATPRATGTPTATATPGIDPNVGRITGGAIPLAGGFGLIVFGGGTSDELLAASGCARSAAAFWTSAGGNFVVWVPGTSVSAVNNEWKALYPSIIPASTALIGKCR